MRDVRMRGFTRRTPLSDVLAALEADSKPLSAEPVSLGDCAGRVLAQELAAPRAVPPFARAAMDGFAVRGEDSFGASSFDPVILEVRGQALPGAPFAGTVGPGEAVRIMTGAPLPMGADAVAKAEICRTTTATTSELPKTVELLEAVAPEKHVGQVGEDVQQGEVLLRAGRRLRPQDVGLLASLGVTEVPCHRRPRVRLIVTGDELLAPGEVPQGSRIVDSNSPMLRALVARDGGLLDDYRLLPDDPAQIGAALSEPGPDVILVTGGSSVGAEDHAPVLLHKLGRLDFHGVTMRPASPSAGGRIGERWVFLLSGNPVSCLCAYEFFAGPTLRALGGRSRSWPHRTLRAKLARKIVSELGRTDYVRVALEDGLVLPLSTAGASILSSTVRAAGAVIVDRDLEGLAEGQEVEVLLYDEDPA